MAWIGPTIAAVGGAASSYLGSRNSGSGGGGGQYAPPRYLEGVVSDYRDDTAALYANHPWPQYPNSPPIGPINPWETQAIGGYGDLGNAALDIGDTYYNSITSGMASNPNAGYAAGFSNAPNMWSQAAQYGPGSVGGSTAGINADPNAALNSAMSGDVTPYTEALEASFGALDRNFEERTLPQLGVLDDQFTGGQGGAGGLKIAQRMQQDLNQRKGEIGAEYALRGTNAALDRQLAGGQVAGGLRLGQAGQSLTGRMSDQNTYLGYLDSLGRGAQVGSGAASNYGQLDVNYMSQFPNAFNIYGAAPGAWGAAGGMARGITDPLFANEFAREQYNEELPWMMNTRYGENIAMQSGGTRPVQNGTPTPNPWAAAALGGFNAWNAYTPPRNTGSPGFSGGSTPNDDGYNWEDDWKG